MMKPSDLERLEKEFTTPCNQVGLLWNMKKGTHVKVSAYPGVEVEGDVVETPSLSSNDSVLELENCVNIDRKTGRLQWMGLHRVEKGEIHSFQTHVEPTLKPKRRKEICFSTILVSTPDEFANLMAFLVNTTEKEIALNFHGIFVSRFGKVGWIVLHCIDSIICVDVIALETVQGFWMKLKIHLFENEKIQKVVFNSRPIVDFLFHQHNIELKNVFDAQVWDFTVGYEELGSNNFNGQGPIYKISSELLEHYLGEEILKDELKMLKDFEKRDYSLKSPLYERPVPEGDERKCVAIDIKYLLRLKERIMSALHKKLHAATCAQINTMIRANNAQMEHYTKHPQQIPPTVHPEVAGKK